MLRLVAGQIRGRPGRSVALLIGVLVATTSFAVLSGAARTGRTEVRGTVAKSFRAQYDLLVRPASARRRAERRQQLIRPGTLTEIPGGITLRQWRRILDLPGVEVAAPIATIGYALPGSAIPIDLSADRRGRGPSLFRVDVTRVTDRGLTRRRDAPAFAYVTDEPLLPWRPNAPTPLDQAPVIDAADGPTRHVCVTGEADLAPQGPYDPVNRARLACTSTRTGISGEGFAPFPKGHAGIQLANDVPVVIAAIDPGQEERLTGLGASLVAGRALRVRDRPSRTFIPEVPVLISTRADTDEGVEATVVRLRGRDARALERATTVRQTRRALRRARGTRVRRVVLSSAAAGRAFVRSLAGHTRYLPNVTAYWTVSDVRLVPAADGAVRPMPVRNDDAV